MMRKIYLSGPMTGIEELNYPLFNNVAALLRATGDMVYNPAEYCGIKGIPEASFNLRRAFSDYLQYICLYANTLVLLPGWEQSKGAMAEFMVARNFPIEIIHWEIVASNFAGLPPYRAPTPE